MLGYWGDGRRKEGAKTKRKRDPSAAVCGRRRHVLTSGLRAGGMTVLVSGNAWDKVRGDLSQRSRRSEVRGRRERQEEEKGLPQRKQRGAEVTESLGMG